MRSAVERSVIELGLEARVEFLGHVDDVAGLFQSSDVCALVSRREGLPRSLMESLSAGVPIVVTPTRGSMDLARIAGCAIAREDSPAAIADAIQVALRDSRSRARIRAEFIEGFADGLQHRVNQDVLSAIAVALLSRSR
jgi:glycosyltransferase involved in cell wall biosynthesis